MEIHRSEDAVVFGVVRIPGAREMSNLGLTLPNVGSERVIVLILFGESLRNLRVDVVGLVDAISARLEVSLPLLSKAIEPGTRRLIVVGDQIGLSASGVFPPQLETPFDFEFLHAAVFFLTLDVRSGLTEPVIGVDPLQVVGLARELVPLALPLIRDVND